MIPNLWNAWCERNGCKFQKGMDQYIIEGVVEKKDIEKILVKLRTLYTDKAQKIGKKPIIFKYQRFEYYNEVPMEETDEFSIEGFWVKRVKNTDDFRKIYNALIKYGKPINVPLKLKDEIEKNMI